MREDGKTQGAVYGSAVRWYRQLWSVFTFQSFLFRRRKRLITAAAAKNIPIVPYIEPPLPWTISFRAVFAAWVRQMASSLHETPCAENGAQERPVQEVAGWKTETI